MLAKEKESSGTYQMYETVAGCAAGLENLVAEEVNLFGGLEVAVGLGVVRWRGTLESAYRCCLWSRFASRVLLELWRFEVTDEDSLYNAALSCDWRVHLTEETSFAVGCTLSGTSKITHSRFAALRVKDGLVDHFRAATGNRPTVKTDRPDIQLHLHIVDNLATISLDLSGESLHRRGYRDASGKAPLKETLAAGIVALSGWLKNPETLIDPFCGTGTLLIEAAMMFGDSAPGLSRHYYGFWGWRGHDRLLWNDLVQEAMAREEAGELKNWPVFLGYDCDTTIIRAARKNIALAGLEHRITIEKREVAFLQATEKMGMLLSNLPYGERLSEVELVTQLYRGYGRILRQRFSGWRVGVFIADPDLTESFAISWDLKFKLFNGSIPCRLLVGDRIKDEPRDFAWQKPAPLDENNSNEFIHRLRKNLQHIMKWAQKESVTCYRIYDRDIPEYNVSIDIYGKWIHVQEWKPPKEIDPQVAASRFHSVVLAVKGLLQVRSDRVFIKTRQRQKGRNQYEKKDNIGKMYEVREGPCSFLVNFTDYLDTGLFLDHRPIRARIFAEAKGKRFLNLFGYTGTATVHAALGGALNTTTVDLSATYLRWARMNFALNGLGEMTNTVEQADCLQWLTTCNTLFNLIFIDPPTFSNTKKEMRVFDVQVDHVKLLDLAMAHLENTGLLIFSTNFKKFRLEEELLEKYSVIDISRQSLPFDFSRDKKIHKCWEFRHQNSIAAENSK